MNDTVWHVIATQQLLSIMKVSKSFLRTTVSMANSDNWCTPNAEGDITFRPSGNDTWRCTPWETDQTQDYHFHVGNAKVSVLPLAIWKWDQRYTHPRSSSWKSLPFFEILSRCLLNMNLLISLSSKYTIYMYNMYNYICIYICDLQHAYMLQVAFSLVFPLTMLIWWWFL